MREGLFRHQAIEYQQTKLQGSVLVVPRLSSRWLALGLVTITLSLIAFAAHGQYARKTTVRGWLEPQQGLQKFYSPSATMRVDQIYVEVGQYVEQGTPLIQLTQNAPQYNGISSTTLLNKEYKKQRDELTKSIESVKSKTAHRKRDIELKKHNLTLQMREIQQLSALNQQQLKLAREQNEKQTTLLHQGYTTQREFDRHLTNLLELEAQTRKLNQQTLSLDMEYASAQGTLENIPLEQDEEIRALRHRLSDIEQKIIQLNSQHTHLITAESSGVVASINIIKGQQVSASLPLASITPYPSQLHAKILVPVRAVTYLENHQDIYLRYDAFPFQKFGLQRGHITLINQDVIIPGESGPLPIVLNEPVYLVNAAIDKQAVQSNHTHVPLKSGMTFLVDINHAERSLLEWLFEPLIALKERA